MNTPSPNSANRNTRMDQSVFSTEIPSRSLVDRMDAVTRHEAHLRGIHVPIAKTLQVAFTLQTPLFTRMASDADLDESSRAHLLLELCKLSLAWLGHRDAHWRKLESVLPNRATQRIAPLHFDQPIDSRDFDGAGAVEFQLYGLPFSRPSKSSVAYWTPQLPIEIFRLEHLGKKVEALRAVTSGMKAIGAALSSTSVYDDVRFLADCGMDYVCILSDVQIDPLNHGRIHLSPYLQTTELALRAIANSGTGMKVLLAGQLSTAEEMHRILRAGVSGVCVDAYVATHQHSQVDQSKEAFGSFLSYANQSSSPLSWVSPVVTELVQQLRDWDTFFGI